MLRYATPLIFGALGGLFSERSRRRQHRARGHDADAARSSASTARTSPARWVGGLLIGMAAGGVFALVHAVFSVSLRADQIVSGTALNFLALGMTGYIFLYHYGEQGTPDNLPQVPDVTCPINVDPVLRRHLRPAQPADLGRAAARALVWLFVFRTPPGLRLRSVGREPAGGGDGRHLGRTGRATWRSIASGALAAMGGAFLSIGFVHSFSQNMTAGRGLHRAGGADLRPLAAGRRARWRRCCSASRRRSRSACRCSRRRRRRCSRRCPYVLTLIAVAGAGRPLDPAGGGRGPVLEGVGGGSLRGRPGGSAGPGPGTFERPGLLSPSRCVERERPRGSTPSAGLLGAPLRIPPLRYCVFASRTRR